jgi:zinc transporter 7
MKIGLGVLSGIMVFMLVEKVMRAINSGSGHGHSHGHSHEECSGSWF